jgi:hypothetical protein
MFLTPTTQRERDRQSTADFTRIVERQDQRNPQR